VLVPSGLFRDRDLAPFTQATTTAPRGGSHSHTRAALQHQHQHHHPLGSSEYRGSGN